MSCPVTNTALTTATRLHDGHPFLIRQVMVFVLLCIFSPGLSSAVLSFGFAEQDCVGEPPFEGAVAWDLGDQFEGQVQLRIGSATGELFAASDGGTGEARTGNWVVPGMKFVLLDQTDGSVLSELVVEAPSCEDQLVDAEPEVFEIIEPEAPLPAPPVRAPVRPIEPPPPPRPEDLARIELDDRAILTLSPPRLRYCGLPVDRATVRVQWDTSELDVDRAHIHVNSLDGEPYADGGVTGERITGDWVTNGTRFLLYLPDQDRVVAETKFRILPCDVAEYPDDAEEEAE